jgi:hypothetical protein
LLTHLREEQHQLTNSRRPPAAIDYGSNTKLPSERACKKVSFPPDRAQLSAQNRQWPPAASRLARIVENHRSSRSSSIIRSSSSNTSKGSGRCWLSTGSGRCALLGLRCFDLPIIDQKPEGSRQPVWRRDLPSPIRAVHSPHWLSAAFWQGSCSDQASCHTACVPSARFTGCRQKKRAPSPEPPPNRKCVFFLGEGERGLFLARQWDVGSCLLDVGFGQTRVAFAINTCPSIEGNGAASGGMWYCRAAAALAAAASHQWWHHLLPPRRPISGCNHAVQCSLCSTDRRMSVPQGRCTGGRC